LPVSVQAEGGSRGAGGIQGLPAGFGAVDGKEGLTYTDYRKEQNEKVNRDIVSHRSGLCRERIQRGV